MDQSTVTHARAVTAHQLIVTPHCVPRRSPSPPQWAALLLMVPLVVVLAALVAPSAVGQGTMGQFPDPISTPELTRLLDRYLHAKPIRPEQWPAIESAHDAYRTEFQALRDGDIQRVLDDSSGMQGAVPSKALIEDLLRRTERVNARIAALDNRLLDQVAVTLDDRQIAALNRVRQARERGRHLSSQATMWIGGRRPTDLSEIALEMDIDAEQRTAVDAILISYEPTLTRHTGQLYDAGSKMLLGIVEAMENAGMANMTQEEFLEDPERMRVMMEIVQQAWAAVTADAQKAAGAIRDLNHRVRRQVADALGAETGREFKRRFVAAAYPGAPAMPARGEIIARTALGVSDLQPQQRQAIESLLTVYLAADDRIVEELIALADTQAEQINPMAMDMEAMEANQEQQSELASRRATLAQELQANVEAIVGQETLATAARERAQRADSDPQPMTAAEAMAARDAASVQGAAPSESVDDAAGSGDAHVRGPITVRQIAAWSGRLGLDPGRRSVFETLHSDYLSDWTATIAPLIESIQSAFADSIQHNDGRTTRNSASLAKMHERRNAAIEAVDALDQRFLTTASAAIATDEEAGLFTLFALERRLTVPTPGFSFSIGADANRESIVNIVGILTDLDDERDLLPIVERVLLTHAADLRRTTADMTGAMRTNEQMMESIGIEFAEAGGDAAKMAEASARMQTQMAESSTRVREAATARRAVNRRVLADLERALPPDRFPAFDRAYRRAAWPTVYSGAGSPMPLIEAGLEMGDLDDEQRTALETLRGETEAAYDAISERMVEASDAPTGMDFSSPEQMQQWTERQQQIQRLRFERNEVASRAIRRVRGILTEAQAERLPGLATFDDALKSREWFEGFGD